MIGSSFERGSAPEVDLAGAVLRNATFVDTHLSGPRFDDALLDCVTWDRGICPGGVAIKWEESCEGHFPRQAKAGFRAESSERSQVGAPLKSPGASRDEPQLRVVLDGAARSRRARTALGPLPDHRRQAVRWPQGHRRLVLEYEIRRDIEAPSHSNRDEDEDELHHREVIANANTRTAAEG